MAIGEEIRQAREEKNLSQEDLAEQLGVSRQAVSKWENGLALPQGINREMLSKILDLKIMQETDETDEQDASDDPEGFSAGRKKNLLWIVGLTLAAVLLVVVLVFGMMLAGPSREQAGSGSDLAAENVPALKLVRFYDKDQNVVNAEALWYNAAGIESILLQWQGGTPTNVRVFKIPAGSETMEQMELLLTKSIPDGEELVLLDAEILKNIGMSSHIFFELDFGAEIVTSDEYNVLYDESMAASPEGDEVLP